ncbi:guanylate-binding protein 1-like isoform X2 [Numida meleagris]|uniref:guanylate-binding protein 1-like isoform X2 n=1 Tax=Numida meleagris TaxID=8996 RepID=UPI000B3DDBF7|nr:guanylate-binding protein 1-like isoform X2 [Numida meleagris]
MDVPVPPMPAPLCLVNNKDGVLSLNPAAMAVLQEVPQPLVVVAIAGPYRTGKSFLMNRLAQRRTGFPLGPTVRAETKGIWMWCLPHPRRPGMTLVLLDTEGLGDPNKGDSHNDAWIFTLALLMSSTLVYNSMGTIDQKALEQLELVTQLSELIRVRDGDKDGNSSAEGEDEAEDCEFVGFFPSFVWVVRDFTLELRVGERPISEDEYLEQALELKHGHGRKVQNYNMTRECLHNYFPTRKCFVLPSPVGAEEHGRLEELPEAALAPRFLQQAAKFCNYVLSSAWPKALPDGAALTGRGLCMLLHSYVDAINSGRLPCLEGAAAVMMANENAAAVAAALEAYARGMRGLSLPAEPARLSASHGEHLREALVVFQRRSFRDRDQEHQRRLMEQSSTEYSRLQEENDAASQRRCRALLAELARALDTSLARGAYAQPGGYRAYEAERQRLLEGYRQADGKGSKAEEVLDEFLAGRRAEAEAVLKADNALSEAEKQLEEAAGAAPGAAAEGDGGARTAARGAAGGRAQQLRAEPASTGGQDAGGGGEHSAGAEPGAGGEATGAQRAAAARLQRAGGADGAGGGGAAAGDEHHQQPGAGGQRPRRRARRLRPRQRGKDDQSVTGYSGVSYCTPINLRPPLLGGQIKRSSRSPATRAPLLRRFRRDDVITWATGPIRAPLRPYRGAALGGKERGKERNLAAGDWVGRSRERVGFPASSGWRSWYSLPGVACVRVAVSCC